MENSRVTELIQIFDEIRIDLMIRNEYLNFHPASPIC
jgi:hypothetical protein